jgi:plastocyanin
MKKVRLCWAAVCLVSALATGCGASSTSESQADTTTAAATITIAGMNYGAPVTVPPGAQIAVKNNDPVEHSVTSDNGGTFSIDVDGKEQGTFSAPSQPGDYPFHCTYHPSMHGTLIVK